jgi:hypothetical protein
MAAGGRQSGHSRFMVTEWVPAQVKPGRPTPTPYWTAWPLPSTYHSRRSLVETTIVPGA